jgi:hypothetical protein
MDNRKRTPRRNRTREADVSPSNPRLAETTIYRSYRIRVHPWTDTIWIERDGFHIGYATSRDDARAIIDRLVE